MLLFKHEFALKMRKTKTTPDTYRMNITITKKFGTLVEERAESLGIKPQEYLKYLIIKDLASNESRQDQETEVSSLFISDKILTKKIKSSIDSAREKRAHHSHETIADPKGIEELLNSKKFKGMRTMYPNTTEI